MQSVPLEPGSIPIHVTDVNGRRWELKYWSDGQIDQLLAKVSRKRFDRDGVTASSLFGIEELFIERLLTCLPLRGHDWVAQRCQQIRDGAFQSCAVARSLAESDNAIEDALGQLAAGDLPSAVLSARNALGFTVDALLESLGVFGSRTPKWRARRFQEAAPAALSFERYWHLETMADLLPDRPQEWVLAVLSTCRELELEIQI